MEYIGISENRLHHIIGVARKSYKIAKDMGFDENFCRRCFMLGWIHDVGYEFSEHQSEHPDISAEMYSQLTDITADENDASYVAIKYHGKYVEKETLEWKILNMADMQIDSTGREVDVYTRLRDIKKRYGEHSDQYLTACDICYCIGLTSVNFAANIT